MAASVTPIVSASPDAPHHQHNALFVFGISMIAAMGGLMFGFDLGIITGVIPYIKLQFGLGDIALGWVVAIFELGCMFGAFGISRYADKYGRKRTMHLNAALLVISSIFAPLSPNATTLTVWRFVQGISVGAASVLSPMYIAEIAPAQSRGRYVSLNQLTIILGILLATISGYVFGDKDTGSDAWRLMLGSAMIPALLFFLLMYFIPETPRWLVKAGRDDEAMRVLARTGCPAQFGEIKKTLTASHCHGKYRDLLAPGLLSAMMLGIGLAVLQQFCGANNVTTYIQLIFEKAQIELTDGLFKGMFVGLVFFFFTFVAIATIDHLGRRKLMLIGTAMMGVILFALAWAFAPILKNEAAQKDTSAIIAKYEAVAKGAGAVMAKNEAAMKAGAASSAANNAAETQMAAATAAKSEATARINAAVTAKDVLKTNVAPLGMMVFILVLAYIATFAFTLGPVTWVLLAEIYPNFIREKALSIASCTLWTATFLVVLVTPYLMNLSPVFNFILFGAMNVIGFFAVWKWLPETNGLTLEEMDKLWER